MLFTQNLFAAGAGITYQGRILNPSGIPITSSNVQFLLQLKSPGSESCLLYQEQQVKNLSASSGVFAITLNDGTGARTDSSGYSINQIFANYGTFTFAVGKCAFGTTYTPITTSDGRVLQVFFNDGTFAGWEPMPVQKINYAPFAIESTQISGFTKDSLLRVEDPTLGPQAASSLTPANFSDLLALINGTSTKYMTSAAGTAASLPPLTSAPITPSTGQIWYNSTTNSIQYYNGTTVQSISPASSTISSLNGLTNPTQTFAIGSTGTSPAYSSVTSTHTLNIPLAATASVTAGLLSNADWTTFNNKVTTVSGRTGSVVLNIADLKSTVAGNFFTGPSCTAGQALTYSSVTDTMSCAAITTTNFSGSLAGDVSGTQGATVVNKIKGTTVSATATVVGQFLIYNGTTQYVPLTMSGDATLSSTGALTLANTAIAAGAYGSATQVPTFSVDAKGRLAAANNVTISGTSPGGTASGDLAGTYPNPTVATVGSATAANVASGANLANAATSANTVNTIVKRDAAGGFSAGEVKFGNTASTCNATNEGQQRYNSTSKNMEFCNGTSWSAIGSSSGTPAGTIVAYGGTTAPSGWLLCDGTLVNRTTYASLFAAIGIAFGSGDGSTTFAIPNTRGLFLRGVTGASGNDPDTASRTASGAGGNTGNLVGSLQADMFTSHSHTYTGVQNQGGGPLGATTWVAGYYGGTTSAAGGNETRPKNIYVNYIIKY